MLSPEQVDEAIETLPGARVTSDAIEARIVTVDYITPSNSTLTVCVLTLDNGFKVVGTSACVDPVNYRPDVGERLAYVDAFDKLWELFGFLLAETRYRDGMEDDDAQ